MVVDLFESLEAKPFFPSPPLPPHTQKPSLSLWRLRGQIQTLDSIWFPLGFLSPHSLSFTLFLSLSWSHPLFRSRIYQIRIWSHGYRCFFTCWPYPFCLRLSRSVFSVSRSLLCFCVIGSRIELRSLSLSQSDVIRFDWCGVDLIWVFSKSLLVAKDVCFSLF